jgi:hypothetical protein
MADFPSKSDPEQDHRRRLLSAARNGQPTAKADLAKEYHVKVYSEAERSALHYEALPQVGRRISQWQLDIGTEWKQVDDVAISDDDDLPSD